MAPTEHFFRAVVDALPSAVFLIDKAHKIHLINAEARGKYQDLDQEVAKTLFGAYVRCVNNGNDRCGQTKACQSCGVRNSIKATFETGKVVRNKAHLVLKNDGRNKDVFALVSASTLNFQTHEYALVTIEDISETIELKGLLPICSHCKQIRDDKRYWSSVEQYIQQHSDVLFSHTICEPCLEKLYPEEDYDDEDFIVGRSSAAEK